MHKNIEKFNLNFTNNEKFAKIDAVVRIAQSTPDCVDCNLSRNQNMSYIRGFINQICTGDGRFHERRE